MQWRSGSRSRSRLEGSAVAGAAYGRDVPGMVGIVAELLAKPPDVHIDAALHYVGFAVTVEAIEQGLPREDPAIGLDQREEQLELTGREIEQRIGAADLVTSGIDHEVAEWHRLIAPSFLRRLGSPEDGLDPADEL